eukprot:854605-Amphidinium_carterae.1
MSSALTSTNIGEPCALAESWRLCSICVASRVAVAWPFVTDERICGVEQCACRCGGNSSVIQEHVPDHANLVLFCIRCTDRCHQVLSAHGFCTVLTGDDLLAIPGFRLKLAL